MVGQEYFAECGMATTGILRNWDAEKRCGMRYNLRNRKMRKSHLSAYKLSFVLALVFIIVIATISSIRYSCKFNNILI